MKIKRRLDGVLGALAEHRIAFSIGALLVTVSVALAVVLGAIAIGLHDAPSRMRLLTTCWDDLDCRVLELRYLHQQASASYAQAAVGLVQAVIGTLSLAVVGVALYYTHRSTSAAVAAAKAASRTADIAQEASRKQLRAYVSASLDRTRIVRGVRTDEGLFYQIELHLMLKNVGTTPALRVRASGLIREVEWPGYGGDEGPPSLNDHSSIQPGDTTDITLRQMVKVAERGQRADNRKIYVRCVVEYEDVFSQGHRIDFHWVYNNTRDWLEIAESGEKDHVVLEVDFQGGRSTSS